MRRHWPAGPEGTNLASGAVAKGEDEIHARRVGSSEFAPAFAAHTRGGQASTFDLAQRVRMDDSGRMAAGAIGGEIWRSFTGEDRFGHDRARRISRTQEEDVVR